MIITFRDELGNVMVEVDEYGVQFLDGVAYFSDGDREYKVALTALVSIVNC